MGIKHPLSDETFSLALSDVVWQFHVYGKNGGEPKKAIKALTKRAPGYSPDIYKEMFDLSLNVLVATIEAVEKAPKSPKPGQEFAEFADVDMEYVMSQLHAQFPGQTDTLLKSYVGMTINWFYMR
ncbi:MAG: hypothetical protein IPP66_20780 [Anaerolineales bacterium]|nr:hypothetical protein [Anaerolineales bacterium]